MKERIFAALFFVVSAAFAIQSASGYWRGHVLRAQESRMHVVANRDHRISDARWKHDERAFLRSASDDENAAFWKLAIAIFAAGASWLSWKNRPYQRYREARLSQSVSLTKAAQPTITVEPSPLRRERSIEERCKDSGRRGEEEIVAALQPLLLEGWEILDRNVDVAVNERKYGDVDIILRSPNGVGFSIDAKNGLERVWVHDEELHFKHRWYRSNREPYPLHRAWTLADWVRDQERYNLKTVRPVIALTASMTHGKLWNSSRVLVTPKAVLCDELRSLALRLASQDDAAEHRIPTVAALSDGAVLPEAQFAEPP